MNLVRLTVLFIALVHLSTALHFHRRSYKSHLGASTQPEDAPQTKPPCFESLEDLKVIVRTHEAEYSKLLQKSSGDENSQVVKALALDLTYAKIKLEHWRSVLEQATKNGLSTVLECLGGKEETKAVMQPTVSSTPSTFASGLVGFEQYSRTSQQLYYDKAVATLVESKEMKMA
eukprot:Platyproteum_vivax@DN12549_c0_g1_i1.p1